MKSSPIFVVALASFTFLTGCDNITGLDNREPPGSVLSGRVVFEGEPVGVRSNGVQLELWQPSYELNQKIPVHIDQDGTFQAVLFDGEYKLNLLPNNGPWLNSSDTTFINLRGEAQVDIPVTPYYVIRDASYSRGAPTAGNPGGTITATFRVGKIDTSRDLEFVGLYVGVTSFVDRNTSVQEIPNSERERFRDAIQTELNSDGTITITVNLPENIYETQSPVIRDFVFARVGVKTVGVSEMLFSPVVEISL